MSKKKKKRRSVFDELFEKDVCFAVCAASSRFINEEIGWFSTDYFVIVHRSELYVIEGFTFYQTDEYRQVYERKLSATDIEAFKMLHLNKFVKIMHNAYGRVYELRDKPFKVAFDNRKKQTRQIVMRG